MSHFKRACVLLLAVSLLAILSCPPAAVTAQPEPAERLAAIIMAEDLRISQVYGGGGNTGATYTHDFVELFNSGSGTVSLSGWSVQYGSATGTTWQVTTLSGSIGPGQYYLIQMAQGTGGTVPLPTPDATGTIMMSATSGKVALANSSTTLSGACPGGVVDFVGYGTANCYEGSGPAATLSSIMAALRTHSGCNDSDDNAADFSAGAPNPRNTASATHTCPLPTYPQVSGTSPANGASGVALGATIEVTFNMEVTTTEPWYSLECPAGTPVSSTWSGSGASWTITPDAGLPGAATCSVTIDASEVTNADSEAMAADYTWTFSTTGCGLPYTAIHAVQGNGLTSPLTSQFVTVEGVVTAKRNASNQLGGIFMQSLAGSEDGDPATSEGIFIYTGNNPAYTTAEGDHVRLNGRVVEWTSAAGSFGQMHAMTQLDSVSGVEVCASGVTVAPAVLSLPIPGDPAAYLERYEGMLVTVSAAEGVYVQQNYFQGRFGQLTLAAGGPYPRLFTPTNGNDSSGAEQVLQRLLVLDDGSHTQNPSPIPYYPADGSLRAGDRVVSLTGVLDQGRINSARSDAADFTATFPYVYYRLHPTRAPVFAADNPRSSQAGPPETSGELSVAAFNVYNFFTTLAGGSPPAGSPYDAANTPRGANTAAEYQRQLDKLVSALAGLDADVVGLIEIEAWSGAAATETLVAALNTRLGGPVYAAVPDPANLPQPGSGGDFIKVALIYKPAAVTPVGPSLVDADPIHNRPPVAQTFEATGSGAVFTVVVNHFKSKSSCPSDPTDPNANYGQGCWNALRVEQAARLLVFIEELVEASGDPDVLVTGDLNAYGGEDPVVTLTGGGLVDQVSRFVAAEERYSYVFDGQAGYLDHMLASVSLSAQVSGAGFWRINTDEPSVIDYNTEFKPVDFYGTHAFRSSDHDPVLAGLVLETEEPAAQRIYLPLLVR